jgi:hypoxia up-regulated 1
MLIREARLVAEKFASQSISDAVITVPPFFNQAERRAMADAAKIAGVNLLQVRCWYYTL